MSLECATRIGESVGGWKCCCCRFATSGANVKVKAGGSPCTRAGATASTRKLLERGRDMQALSEYPASTTSRQHGHCKTNRKALGGSPESDSLFIARIRHARPPHKPPPNGSHPRPACPQTSRARHRTAYRVTARNTTASRLPHIHQETQSHPHILGAIGVSELHREALRGGVARRGPGGEGARRGRKRMEEGQCGAHRGR